MTESDQRVLVRSELLGEFEVSPGQLIDFNRGLPGFPEGHTYALLAAGRDGVFWLQSLEYSALSFLLIDPFPFFPGYDLELTEEDFARLGTSNPSELLVLAIVTLGASPDQGATANLRAPLLVNLRDRTAHQSIRADGTHGVRQPLDTGSLAA